MRAHTLDPMEVEYLRKTSSNDDLNHAPRAGIGRVVALLAAYLAAWLASRPYPGIVGDAQLYVLQTLATLNPHPLGDDLFLRFGSQNNFTLFPHLVAPLVTWFGLEAAAAGITLASALLLLVSGWCLARCLSNARLAWLAVGLLIGMQGWYGADQVFRFDELYLNARVPAEVLSIVALVCACLGRWLPALLCACVAMMIHPVMAAPGLGLLVLLAIDKRAPDRYRYVAATVTAVAGALLLAMVVRLLAPDPGPDHPLWITMIRSRTPFLFVQEWLLADWLRNAMVFASLAVTADALKRAEAGRVAYFATVIGLAGIGLAALASLTDGFDLLLVAQTWRWTWLSSFVALILLPATLATLWKSGTSGRAAALLLASGWALYNYSGGAVALGAAVLWFARGHLDGRSERAQIAGGSIAAIAAVGVLLTLGVQAIPLSLDVNSAPGWVQRIVNLAGLAGPMLLIVSLAWFGAVAARSTLAPTIVGVVSVIALTGLVPYNSSRLVGQSYSEQQRAAFAPWREAIPPSAEVFWQDPVAAWVLLGRKSFLSGSQSAGLLYSPVAAREFARRSRSLSAWANPGWWILAALDADDAPKPLSHEILRAACKDPELDFVVDTNDLGSSSLRAEWPGNGQFVYLYDCSRFRHEADR